MTYETPNAPKKPYAEPRLLVYGGIREITKHGGGGNGDATGHSNNHKTGT
jgi:hypothetical protein